MDLAEKNNQQDDSIQIGNEFTTVHVRKVYTRNGERLEIESKKLGFTIRLDAMQLESLTWQSHELFSRLLENSMGPLKEKAQTE